MTLLPHELQPIRLLCPLDFAGNSTGVDCHFLLQRIFPTQRSNPGLPHCRQTLYHLSHQESLILRQNDPQTGGFREPWWARTKSESYPPLEVNKRACRGRQCSADLVAPKSLFMVWSLWAWSTEQTWNVVSGPSKDQKSSPAVGNGCGVSRHHDAKLPSLWIYLKQTI